MPRDLRSLALAIFALAIGGGCSLVIDAGSYHSRDDGGASAMDAGADAGTDGAVDGGPDAATDCDPACGAGEACVDGVCQCGGAAACTSGSACCDGSCTPLGTVTDCSACGATCESGAHASASCEGGSCASSCDDGFDDCDGAPGCEQSLLTAAHCGSCSNACGAGEVCALVGGTPTCTSSCAGGETECDGACVDTSANVLHCGRCGNACPEPSGGSASCVGGVCQSDCDPGYGLCGGTCLALARYWPDGDGDGYGSTTGTPLQDCPGSPPSGYAASSNDCDDGRATIHPGATESCDGVDEDCDGTTDDGFMCTGAETRACTMMVGTCTVTGVQTCSACTYGACEVDDVCDRTDDDCDGYVDEGGFRVDAPRMIMAEGPYRPGNVRADYNPVRREVGLVWRDLVGSDMILRFARLDATTGARVGSVATLLPTGLQGYSIAYDGAHYTVAAVDNGQAVLFRVDASSGAVSRVATLETMSGYDIDVGRMGDTGSNIAVAWVAGTPSRSRLARFTMPATSSGTPTAIGSTQDITTTGYSYGGRVVSTPAGALVFYVVGSGTPPNDLHVGAVSASSVGTFSRRMAGRAAGDLYARYEPTTNTVGAAINVYAASTNSVVFQAFDPMGGLVGAEIPVAGQGAGGVAWAGEPGQLAIFSGMYFPITGELTRVRMSDRVVLPTAPLRVSDVSGIIGIPDGPVRYLYVGDDGTNINAYPIVCR